jgi:thymidylate kinase
MCSIVLEGLDGVGKTTTLAALCARLGAQQLRTPPDELRPFREFFDGFKDSSPDYRAGFYMAGNFLAGARMEAAVREGRRVVCDRYVFSTRAYRLAYGAELPPAGDAQYEWPSPALHRPTLTVVLSLPEAVRLARRAGRVAEAETAEERKLREEPAFAGRVMEAFRRLGAVEVSAEGSTEEVVDRIVAAAGL